MKYIIHKSLINPDSLKRIITQQGKSCNGISISIIYSKQVTVYEPSDLDDPNILGEINDQYVEIQDLDELIDSYNIATYSGTN